MLYEGITVALATGLIGLSLVFNHTGDLAGWTRPELLAVMGVHILMGGLIRAAIQPNMMTLANDVQQIDVSNVGGRVDRRRSEVVVITSYSIHYTKLYDKLETWRQVS